MARSLELRWITETFCCLCLMPPGSGYDQENWPRPVQGVLEGVWNKVRVPECSFFSACDWLLGCVWAKRRMQGLKQSVFFPAASRWESSRTTPTELAWPSFSGENILPCLGVNFMNGWVTELVVNWCASDIKIILCCLRAVFDFGILCFDIFWLSEKSCLFRLIFVLMVFLWVSSLSPPNLIS